MIQISQDVFIKKAMKGYWNDSVLINFGKDGYAHTQGLYLKNTGGGCYHGYVKIPFNKQNELQQGGYIKIINASNSKEFSDKV